jgi:hypothetical protein
MSGLSSVPVETQTGDDIPLVAKQQSVSGDLEEGKVHIKDPRLNEESFSSQDDKPLGLPTPVTMVVDSMPPKVGSDSPRHTPTISLGGAKMELKVTSLIPIWIILSSSLIIYNNYIFHTLQFKFPVFLFMWHLIFTAIGTRILARTTHLLDALKTTDIEPAVGISIIFPIATLFLMSSLSSNLAYAHLSGGYIQKLKVRRGQAIVALLPRSLIRSQAFNPVIILLFYRMARKTSRRVFTVVLAIGFGVCMANYDNTPGFGMPARLDEHRNRKLIPIHYDRTGTPGTYRLNRVNTTRSNRVPVARTKNGPFGSTPLYRPGMCSFHTEVILL